MISAAWFLRGVPALLCLLATSLAWADESKRVDVKAAHRAACASAYESAQEAKIENRLRDAKRELAICAEAQCPEFVRADCAQWFEEVSAAVPSVVFRALDERGTEITDVRVFVDDKLVARRLDGLPIELEPGEHVFRFERAGAEPQQHTALIRAGEKNRALEASWVEGQPTTWAQAEPGPLRPYSYVMGGVAGAALVSFGMFGILGRQQEKSVKEKCEADLANCPLNEIDEAEQKLLIADISLGIAAASLIAGVTLFVLSEPKDAEGESERSVRLDLGLSGAGLGASLKGSF